MTLGFISTVFFLEALRARFGRARAHLLAQILVVAGHIPIVCTPPYAVVVVCFFFIGVGVSMNLAMNNVFVANLQKSTHLLGYMHGSYGIGGELTNFPQLVRILTVQARLRL